MMGLLRRIRMTELDKRIRELAYRIKANSNQDLIENAIFQVVIQIKLDVIDILMRSVKWDH